MLPKNAPYQENLNGADAYFALGAQRGQNASRRNGGSTIQTGAAACAITGGSPAKRVIFCGFSTPMARACPKGGFVREALPEQ